MYGKWFFQIRISILVNITECGTYANPTFFIENDFVARSKEIDQNYQINPISSFSNGFVTTHVCFTTYCLRQVWYIFHVKIQLFVTAKSDLDPDLDQH
jgi:hypothetical protein